MAEEAEETSVPNEQNAPAYGEKSLLLPIRSLKSCILDSDGKESKDEHSVRTDYLRISSSNSGLTKFISGKMLGFSPLDSEGSMEDAVLHSPIPWRSRSGRMEINEEGNGTSNSLFSSTEDPRFDQLESSFRSLSSRSSTGNSACSSPEKFSSSPSMSCPTSQKSSPILSPASQLSTPFLQKSLAMKSNSTVTNDKVAAEKELNRSFMSVPKELSGSNIEDVQSKTNSLLKGKSVRTIRPADALRGAKKREREIREYGTDGKADTRPKLYEENGTKSVRTIRPAEALRGAKKTEREMGEYGTDSKAHTRPKLYEENGTKSVGTIRPAEALGGAKKPEREIGEYGTDGKAETQPKLYEENGTKSGRTIRPAEALRGAKKQEREIGEYGTDGKADTQPKLYDENGIKSVRTIRPAEALRGAKKPGREIGEYETDGKADTQPKLYEENGTVGCTYGNALPVEKKTSTEFPGKEEKKKSIEEVIVKTDKDAESEEDCCADQEVESEADSDDDGGPDVDKKADEFIAKFREQIMLQRNSSTRS